MSRALGIMKEDNLFLRIWERKVIWDGVMQVRVAVPHVCDVHFFFLTVA